jgi:hypothetical protein
MDTYIYKYKSSFSCFLCSFGNNTFILTICNYVIQNRFTSTKLPKENHIRLEYKAININRWTVPMFAAVEIVLIVVMGTGPWDVNLLTL